MTLVFLIGPRIEFGRSYAGRRLTLPAGRD
jgi:hypothetical protein